MTDLSLLWAALRTGGSIMVSFVSLAYLARTRKLNRGLFYYMLGATIAVTQQSITTQILQYKADPMWNQMYAFPISAMAYVVWALLSMAGLYYFLKSK